MIRSMYSGVSGLKNHQTKMDVIGNNVANVNTYGYKAQRTAFSDVFSQTIGSGSAPEEDGIGGININQVGLGVQLAAINTNWGVGSAQQTEVETNCMIEGDGFFMLQGTSEDEKFVTRVGNFELDREGNLCLSGLGYKVLNVDGDPININTDEYSNISIDKLGKMWGINPEGAKEEIPDAQIAVVNFTNPSELEKMGNSLYAFDPASENIISEEEFIATYNGSGKILSGVLEMSNVNLAEEFTDMIVTQRGYQANSRVITVSDTLLEELINLKR